MSYADTILPEFDHEMASTRKVLERVPEDKLDWKAHPKLNSIGWNAAHVAEILGCVEQVLLQPQWDFAPPGGEAYVTPKFTSRKELLEFFDRNVASARKAIGEVREEAMGETWSLLYQGNSIFAAPRAGAMRGFIMNHLIHHRAILYTYLRMNDVPLPGMYGPGGEGT